MSSKETMLKTFARFSENNIPMLVLDSFESEVQTIWKLANRSNNFIVLGERVEVSSLIVLAQNTNYDAILVRNLENLEMIKQEHLAHTFSKLKSEEKGKFIFTAYKFENIYDELLRHLCKITYLPKESEKYYQQKHLGWAYE